MLKFEAGCALENVKWGYCTLKLKLRLTVKQVDVCFRVVSDVLGTVVFIELPF